MAKKGEFGWTKEGRVFVPDVRIKVDKPEYVYHPLRGYSGSLAVFDIDDRCIGWIDTRTLGYENAKAWMAGTRYLLNLPALAAACSPDPEASPSMTCDRFRSGDVTVFACSRKRTVSHRCSCCGSPATKQCDAALRGSKQGRTCDRYLCDACAVAVGPDTDLCPAHARETREHPGPSSVLRGEDCLRQLRLPMPPPKSSA